MLASRLPVQAGAFVMSTRCVRLRGISMIHCGERREAIGKDRGICRPNG